ncbi:serine kinase of the HPr protein, regulates carbohydrate metabolism [Desulfosporosinus orientis DSM 765]|uniref:Serine kinase of the HPr protein, regulates carbohydrate metabolism n=1 Tax=Desulfosporosinus orientis (strain ATCC 19365 / DSM 765 / NCIMB 8382 / VKM B-1628 / Singapore I) TaxID=768706 RepID=G7WJQ5_DESOD|nr:serine kinase of the HPr protein, regulates carbohydrate metabolism [Desulfosporosinus orientis]AET70492.1 serine kinase of the HPr protein, regulates carbohydrate metabolism [Desulfosporosinus orientis DSM 765]
MYSYKAFGLTIISEIEIAELILGEGKPDVAIMLGPVSIVDHKKLDDFNYYKISKSEFKLDVKGVAKYCVRKGDCIIVNPEKNSDQDTIKAYLMGIAMGVLLIQRGVTAIHGSSVDIDGISVIFTGECGVGKSTLCSAFRKKGYQYLADDISVVTFGEEGIPVVHPAFAQQRLCSDTAEMLGYDLSTLPLVCTGEDKYAVNTGDDFESNAIPLRAIVEIKVENKEKAMLKKVNGIDRIRCIKNNIYCILLYEKIGLSSGFIEQYINIAKNISVYRLIRPEGQFTVEEQIKLVVNAVSDRTEKEPLKSELLI